MISISHSAAKGSAIGGIKDSNKINIHIYATNDLNNIIFGVVQACDPNPLTDPFRFSLTENISITIDPFFVFEVYSPNKQNRTIQFIILTNHKRNVMDSCMTHLWQLGETAMKKSKKNAKIRN